MFCLPDVRPLDIGLWKFTFKTLLDYGCFMPKTLLDFGKYELSMELPLILILIVGEDIGDPQPGPMI
jgi:hypothetical protein